MKESIGMISVAVGLGGLFVLGILCRMILVAMSVNSAHVLKEYFGEKNVHEVVNETSEALARLEKYGFTEKGLKFAEKTAKKDSKVPVAVPVNNPFSSKEYMKVEKTDWNQSQKVIKKGCNDGNSYAEYGTGK